MQGVYRFKFDAGRNGTLHGLFVAEDDDVKAIIGRDAYFGEVLGKHSEVQGPIEEGDIKLITQDQDFVAKFIEYGCATGYSPWDGLQDEESEDEEDDGDE
jgi:hypothetical protein